MVSKIHTVLKVMSNNEPIRHVVCAWGGVTDTIELCH